ncbi:MAG: hypothetical protein KKA81_16740 [Bacteroidetes bacterium]|nr:hypothetical protein [Bacteroidota bacterium]
MKTAWVLALLLIPAAVFAAEENGRRAEHKLEGDINAARSEVRRTRRRIKKARRVGNEETAARLDSRLGAAKEEHRRRRRSLVAAVERGEVSPRYRRLKGEIREDLNAVRRARHALKKAVGRSDNKAAVRAQERLRKTKQRLKSRRRLLRELMRKGAKGKRRKQPERSDGGGAPPAAE